MPAHNEEQLLGRGLAAIDAAIQISGSTAEVIVVANRCTDGTEAIAQANGAIVVSDASRTIAAIRNVGVAASIGRGRGDDRCRQPDARARARRDDRLIDTGTFVGGGCEFVPERNSLGLATTSAVLRLALVIGRIGGVMFWCRRDDFDAIGGFDESLVCAEDLHFAHRLRRHGKATGSTVHNLRGVPVIVCCRKFDQLR